MGVHDPAGRGLLVNHSLRYISFHHPAVVVFENVEAFLDKKYKELKDHVEAAMRAEGYRLHRRILNARLRGGIPQNRPRVYYGCLLRSRVRDDRPFCFPGKIPCLPLRDVLDPICPGENCGGLPKDTQAFATSTVKRAQADLAKGNLGGVLPISLSQDLVMDADEGRQEVVPRPYAPALVRARQQGIWLLSRGRRARPLETIRLQGICTAGLYLTDNPRHSYAMAGNGMTVSVVGRTIGRALFSAGLVDNVMDPWKDGEALSWLVEDAKLPSLSKFDAAPRRRKTDAARVPHYRSLAGHEYRHQGADVVATAPPPPPPPPRCVMAQEVIPP